jgi:hypothetical protein
MSVQLQLLDAQGGVVKTVKVPANGKRVGLITHLKSAS